jgi:hypothetical protein
LPPGAIPRRPHHEARKHEFRNSPPTASTVQFRSRAFAEYRVGQHPHSVDWAVQHMRPQEPYRLILRQCDRRLVGCRGHGICHQIPVRKGLERESTLAAKPLEPHSAASARPLAQPLPHPHGAAWIALYVSMDSEAKWGQVVGNIVSEWTQIVGLVLLTKRLIERRSKESTR